MSFSIRVATPSDAPDLVRLINSLAEYERLAHESHPDEATLARQLSEDASPRIEALVAIDQGSDRCVGFALYFHNYSTFLTNFGLFLEDLFVEPDFRGQGIGLALFRALAAIARDRGCQRLDWNVLDWNEPAIGFYQKLGAKSLSYWITMRLSREAIEALA
ncbi:MAG: GNAT family N-acetyltransferase, partial [Bacteroidota bacterium]|nr:GNAT family N-acetyltransferase [Bacteroidota bacterium]